MSKIIFEQEYNETDIISVFAFNTGTMIERIIDEQTQGLENKYKSLGAKIMNYYMQLPEGEEKSKFGGYFGIIRHTK